MDPFAIAGPTCISFSGGRTSAYMLWRFLQANDGLPPDAVVCFANTGKEDEATLRFIDRCSQEWGVPITWLEWDCEERFRVVNFGTASRNGEPFEKLIRKKNYLPNPVTRFCTGELKIRPMHWFLRSLGWDEYDMATGIRADEPRRVAKIRARGTSSESKDAAMILPLDDAEITLQHVNDFWKQQPFNLELVTVNGKTMEGNCDLCFLKSANQIYSLIRLHPERAVWWAEMETLAQSSSLNASGARFRNDRPSYAEMLKAAEKQSELFRFEDTAIECFCGD